MNTLLALLGFGWVERYRRPYLDIRIENEKVIKIPSEVIFEYNVYTNALRSRVIY